MTTDLKKLIELRECPFCGEHLVKKSDHHGTWMEHKSSPGKCFISHIQLHDSHDYADWNTRSYQSRIEKLEAALREITQPEKHYFEAGRLSIIAKAALEDE